MKQMDIEKIYSEKVAEYLMNGYTVSTTTMSGHQGAEIAKIDVTDGTDIIRILLERSAGLIGKEHRPYEAVILTVGRGTEQVKRDKHCRPFDNIFSTIWNDRLDVIERRTFFQIDRDADFFTEDESEYSAWQDVQLKRAMSRTESRLSPESVEMPEAAKQIAVRYLKRKTGKSRISTKDVKVTKKCWKKENRYYVTYLRREYRLA